MKLIEIITGYLQSNNDFPVDFEAFWKWCGFARKDSAKRTLEKNFIKGVDYILHRVVENNPVSKSNPLIIYLTTDCAKSFAMLAQTEKGKEVRVYFLECEKRLKALTQPTSIFDVMESAIQQLREQDVRITALEESKRKSEEELAAISEEPTQALFADTRKALDNLVKAYAVANEQNPQDVYRVLYLNFTQVTGKQVYQNARKAKKSPIAWIESRGLITAAYDLAQQLFGNTGQGQKPVQIKPARRHRRKRKPKPKK